MSGKSCREAIVAARHHIGSRSSPSLGAAHAGPATCPSKASAPADGSSHGPVRVVMSSRPGRSRAAEGRERRRERSCSRNNAPCGPWSKAWAPQGGWSPRATVTARAGGGTRRPPAAAVEPCRSPKGRHRQASSQPHRRHEPCPDWMSQPQNLRSRAPRKVRLLGAAEPIGQLIRRARRGCASGTRRNIRPVASGGATATAPHPPRSRGLRASAVLSPAAGPWQRLELPALLRGTCRPPTSGWHVAPQKLRRPPPSSIVEGSTPGQPRAMRRWAPVA